MVTIVTSHWKENLEWLKQSEFPVVLVDKEGAEPSCFEPTWVIPNKGLETSAYLKFIIERYHNLPEYTAFIHGHETAHHQKHPRPILELIKNANTQKHGFISLNNWYRDCCLISDGDGHNMPEQWDLFKISCKKRPPFEAGFIINNVPVAAQFIVSKSRILSNPLEVYQRWYDILLERNNPKDSVFFEHVWFIIFKEDIWYNIPDDLFLLPYVPHVHWGELN